MTNDAPMTLDDNVDSIDAMPAKDVDGIPYCRKHHCRMKQKSGGKKESPTVYYGCPVPKCKEKSQIIKTTHPGVVPAQPQPCPRCSKGAEPAFCERDEHSSTAASVILRCPDCGWKSSALAVPQLAAAHFARRREPPITNIGDR